MNTDPAKIEEKGHFLYARYDIHPTLATVTGAGVVYPGSGTQLGGTGGPTLEPIASLQQVPVEEMQEQQPSQITKGSRQDLQQLTHHMSYHRALVDLAIIYLESKRSMTVPL